MEELLSHGMWQPSRSSSMASSCADSVEYQAPTLVSMLSRSCACRKVSTAQAALHSP